MPPPVDGSSKKNGWSFGNWFNKAKSKAASKVISFWDGRSTKNVDLERKVKPSPTNPDNGKPILKRFAKQISGEGFQNHKPKIIDPSFNIAPGSIAPSSKVEEDSEYLSGNDNDSVFEYDDELFIPRDDALLKDDEISVSEESGLGNSVASEDLSDRVDDFDDSVVELPLDERVVYNPLYSDSNKPQNKREDKRYKKKKVRSSKRIDSNKQLGRKYKKGADKSSFVNKDIEGRKANNTKLSNRAVKPNLAISPQIAKSPTGNIPEKEKSGDAIQESQARAVEETVTTQSQVPDMPQQVTQPEVVFGAQPKQGFEQEGTEKYNDLIDMAYEKTKSKGAAALLVNSLLFDSFKGEVAFDKKGYRDDYYNLNVVVDNEEKYKQFKAACTIVKSKLKKIQSSRKSGYDLLGDLQGTRLDSREKQPLSKKSHDVVLPGTEGGSFRTPRTIDVAGLQKAYREHTDKSLPDQSLPAGESLAYEIKFDEEGQMVTGNNDGHSKKMELKKVGSPVVENELHDYGIKFINEIIQQNDKEIMMGMLDEFKDWCDDKLPVRAVGLSEHLRGLLVFEGVAEWEKVKGGVNFNKIYLKDEVDVRELEIAIEKAKSKIEKDFKFKSDSNRVYSTEGIEQSKIAAKERGDNRNRLKKEHKSAGKSLDRSLEELTGLKVGLSMGDTVDRVEQTEGRKEFHRHNKTKDKDEARVKYQQQKEKTIEELEKGVAPENKDKFMSRYNELLNRGLNDRLPDYKYDASKVKIGIDDLKNEGVKVKRREGNDRAVAFEIENSDGNTRKSDRKEEVKARLSASSKKATKDSKAREVKQKLIDDCFSEITKHRSYGELPSKLTRAKVSSVFYEKWLSEEITGDMNSKKIANIITEEIVGKTFFTDFKKDHKREAVKESVEFLKRGLDDFVKRNRTIPAPFEERASRIIQELVRKTDTKRLEELNEYLGKLLEIEGVKGINREKLKKYKALVQGRIN